MQIPLPVPKMKRDKKIHDMLILVGEPGPISVIISIVNLIHNGCEGFSYTNTSGGKSGIGIPKSYDFVDMKRILSDEHKKWWGKGKDFDCFKLTRQEYIMDIK